jgi:CRISPR-associated endonuclease/helicase Cas3
MTHNDFSSFFEALHGQLPFPWQTRLARQVAKEKRWPPLLDLPTGSGKTAAIDVAVFAMALDADRPKGKPRSAARRVFFVVDRRIVVDEAARRAGRIVARLRSALHDPKSSPILHEVARRLVKLAGWEPDIKLPDEVWPLRVAVLRGGMYRDDTWAHSPAQPIVCASTVDQVGSRLLFRGYGLGRSGRVSHAGLVGNDSLILVDEAHLSRPFLTTVEAVQALRQPNQPGWGPLAHQLPFQVVPMSATPGGQDCPFSLGNDDRENETLKKRLTASKIACLHDEVPTTKDEEGANQGKLAERLAEQAVTLSASMVKAKTKTYTPRVVGIVVNRVDTARRVFRILKDEHEKPREIILLTGRVRPIDRDRLLRQYLKRMQAGRNRDEDREMPLFVVATQTIECGADLDLDALVTEAAPLDALRQRFGRLDRLGELRLTRSVIVARKDAVAANADDPVYGKTVAATWKWLHEQADASKRKDRSLDFGIDALASRLPTERKAMDELCSPKAIAPVLLPSHLDAWVQTEPVPVPDPDVSLFLHGPQRSVDVQLVWRADLPQDEDKWAEAASLSPPTTLEALPVPLRAACAWLARAKEIPVADIEGQPEPPEQARSKSARRALRWRGPDDAGVVEPDQIRPGDTLVVPASYGGADEFGWEPNSEKPVQDVGDLAAILARGKPVLRIHPDVIACWYVTSQEEDSEAVRDRVRRLLESFSTEAEDAVFSVDPVETLASIANWSDLPEWVKVACDVLIKDRDRKCSRYATAGSERTFVVRGSRRLPADKIRMLVDEQQLDEGDVELLSDLDPDGPTGDDASSFRDVHTVTLGRHCRGVAELAIRFARAICLPEHVISDLDLAGLLHDIGKVDPRFQAWLHGGDEVATALEPEPLAKSKTARQDREAINRARARARYPTLARHEALSLGLIRSNPSLWGGTGVADISLVDHLIGTHHGWGRPFWPVVNDLENPTVMCVMNRARPFWDTVPSGAKASLHNGLDRVSLSCSARHGLERLDSGWTDQFWRLVGRYGPWGLALLEAILILADHHLSRAEQEDGP